jgi:acetyl-CoA carboxylase alpha subunit
MRITAPDLLELGVVDEIVEEPVGGAHTDPDAACERVGERIGATLDELVALDTNELLRRRYERYRHLGVFIDG